MPPPQVAPLPYTYCTQADIENVLSINGVKLRLDDDSDGVITAQEQQRITDSINDASETINYYCWDKYDPGQLVTSNWVNRRCTILAAYCVCRSRGNPVPDSILDEATRAEELLTEVRDGPGKLPNVALRRLLAPVWSNIRVDPNYIFRCVRVERNQSSQYNPTTLPQNVDYSDQNCWET